MTTSSAADKSSAANKRSAADKSTTAKKAATPAKKAVTPAKKAATPRRRSTPRLRGVAAVQARLATDRTPIVFVGPTPYNLLGLDRWLGGLRYVSRHDPFDGAHPRVFAPTRRQVDGLVTGTDVTNHLLGDPEVRAHLAALEAESGAQPKITTVYADAETERLSAELGYQLIVPTVAERERVAATVGSAASETGERAGGRPVTMAAVVTRHGTLLGTAVTSLIGHPALTADPYAWSGAESLPQLLTTGERAQAGAVVDELGQRLAAGGFHGYLEAQLLVDDVTGLVRLTDAAPGIGAAAALATTAAGAYADLPLYAVHVLEHLGVEYDLDVAELNRRAADLAVLDAQSQLVVSETGFQAELIVDAPVTGRYAVDELGRAHLVERSQDWHGLVDAGEFYFLRLAGAEDHRWLGSDLGVVITRGSVQDVDPAYLTTRATTMIDNVRSGFVGVPTCASSALDSLTW